jgi:hypothetical protein
MSLEGSAVGSKCMPLAPVGNDVPAGALSDLRVLVPDITAAISIGKVGPVDLYHLTLDRVAMVPGPTMPFRSDCPIQGMTIIYRFSPLNRQTIELT